MSCLSIYNPFYEIKLKGAYMKKAFLLLTLLLSFSVFSKDMSRTENYDDVYKQMPNGTSKYFGACSVHENKVGISFEIEKKLVEYMDLDAGELSREEFLEATRVLEIDIINAAEKHIGVNIPLGIDDFAADKLKNTKIEGLDLYRLNIGIGGGNGLYLIYNRTETNGLINYELMAEIFDGDVNFCDSKVWLFKSI